MSYSLLLKEDQPYDLNGDPFKFYAGVERVGGLKVATATFKFADRTVVIKYTMLTRKYAFMNPGDPINDVITFKLSNSCWYREVQ